jgi:hypothetical protein
MVQIMCLVKFDKYTNGCNLINKYEIQCYREAEKYKQDNNRL